jgi:hypothetical protein
MAGFMLCTVTDERFHPSAAPKFVDVTGVDDMTELQQRCEGHYVRAKVTTSKVKELEDLREFLTKKCGARGVTLNVVREPARTRVEGATVKAGASIETSVADFVNATVTENKEEVQKRALQVLAEAA